MCVTCVPGGKYSFTYIHRAESRSGEGGDEGWGAYSATKPRIAIDTQGLSSIALGNIVLSQCIAVDRLWTIEWARLQVQTVKMFRFVESCQ